MVQAKLEEILKQIAETKNITNYEICPHKDALIGDGFLSECYTGEVINKNTGLKIEAYIKIAPSYIPEFIPAAYFNECHFYSKIFPELNKFQIKKGVKRPFNNIPVFYCGDDQEGRQYVAMENLKIKKYDILDKSKKMNQEYLKLIFDIYGKFHALVIAFKDHNEKRYLELTKPLNDLVKSMSQQENPIFIKACDAVKETDIDLYKKIKPVVENWKKYLSKAMAYDGKYSGLTHGDCWSNNMLFKCRENGQIEDMKLIDFQLCRHSTPIHDLSYFFYSGASKEDFMKLDEYLDLYHKSFSAFAKELGSDPEKILPLNDLKFEWKRYGFMGLCTAVILWQHKLTSKEKIVELVSGDNVDEKLQNFHSTREYSDVFKNNAHDIFIHAVEYGIIECLLTL